MVTARQDGLSSGTPADPASLTGVKWPETANEALAWNRPTVEPPSTVEAAGLHLIKLGLPVFPVGRDKKPMGRWRNGDQDYVTNAMSPEEWQRRAQDLGVHGVAVLGSHTYGTVILDIESAGMKETMIQATLEILPDECIQCTPSGGRHAYIMVSGDHPGGNEKLARGGSDDGPVLLAERRGHGGYAVIVGPGRPPLPARFKPAMLTRQEYDTVEGMLRAAGTYVSAAPMLTHYERKGEGGGTGDVITEALRSGALSPLTVLPSGWAVAGHDKDGRTFIVRPGANSETSGNVRNGVVVIHSTAVDWAEPGRPISGAETLARARFSGDYAAAMRWVERSSAAVVMDGDEPPAGWPTEVLEAVHEARLGAKEPAPVDQREADVANPLNFIDWPTLWSEETVEREVLIPGILNQGGSAVLYSASGAGKSLLALDLAVNLATGGTLLGEATEPRPILYMDLEQDRALLRERLEELGVSPKTDLSGLHYSLLGDWPPLDTKAGGDALVTKASELKVALVVIDTTSRVIEGGENEADTFLRLYRHTGRRLKAAGVALLRLDHSGKNLKKGQRGSSAKDSDVDQVYRLTQVSENQVNLKREKNRLHFDGPDLVALHREDNPLRHVLKSVDTVREQRLDEIAAVLETCDAPRDISRRAAAELLQQQGVKARTQLIAAALARWRLQKVRSAPGDPRMGGSTMGTTDGESPGNHREPSGNHEGTDGNQPLLEICRDAREPIRDNPPPASDHIVRETCPSTEHGSDQLA